MFRAAYFNAGFLSQQMLGGATGTVTPPAGGLTRQWRGALGIWFRSWTAP